MFRDFFQNIPKKILDKIQSFFKLDIKSRKRKIKDECGEFGFSKSNPIPVELPWGENAYLSRLRCPCGEPFSFQRIGSCGAGPDGHIIDLFVLICRKRKHRYRLYFDMYHPGIPSQCPKGLTLSTSAGVDIPEGLENVRNKVFEHMEKLVKRRE